MSIDIDLSLIPSNQIVQVPLHQLRPHPLNKEIYGDEPVDPDLLDEVRRAGKVINPLTVLTDGRIVCGHRRRSCAALCGFSTVPCIVAHDLVTDAMVEWRLIQDNRTCRTRSTWQRANEIAHLNKLVVGVKAKDRMAGGTRWGELDVIRAEALVGLPEEEVAHIREIIRQHAQSKSDKSLDICARYYGSSPTQVGRMTALVKCVQDLAVKGFAEESAQLKDLMNRNVAEAMRQSSKYRHIKTHTCGGTRPLKRSTVACNNQIKDVRSILLNLRFSLNGTGETIVQGILKELARLPAHIITEKDVDDFHNGVVNAVSADLLRSEEGGQATSAGNPATEVASEYAS